VDYLWRFRHLIAPAGGWRGAAKAVVSEGGPGVAVAVDESAHERAEVLLRGRLTVAVAESCTGGLVGSLITDQPGSSAYFLGGVIAYADEVKRDQLGVPAALLKRVGAVSSEVAEAMAVGARSRFGSTLSVGVTGIAGPDADGSGKPIGLTYIAVAAPGGVSSHEYTFHGDRWSNRRQAATRAVRLLIEAAGAIERSSAKTA
jgi:nicotinamide-nucleotide amidase